MVILLFSEVAGKSDILDAVYLLVNLTVHLGAPSLADTD